jgi:hypothetical protein
MVNVKKSFGLIISQIMFVVGVLMVAFAIEQVYQPAAILFVGVLFCAIGVNVHREAQRTE